MSDDLPDNVNQTILDQIRILSEQVQRLQSPENPAPHREDRPVPQLIVLSEQLIAACPSINGQHFFRAPEDPADDVVLTEPIVFPKNREQQYSAPALDRPWPQDAGLYQKFDKTLQQVQETFAFLTRPLDDFAAEVSAAHPDENTRNAVADFAHLMRSQLALAARRITDTRMDYYVQAKGLKPAPSDEKNTIPQDALSARVKKAESYATDSAPRRGSSSRSFTGQRYGYRRYRSYFGNFPQQQQQQPQQQFQQQQLPHQAQFGGQYQPTNYQQIQQNGAIPQNNNQFQYFPRGRGRGRGRAQYPRQ
jgi:hypothetical protein